MQQTKSKSPKAGERTQIDQEKRFFTAALLSNQLLAAIQDNPTAAARQDWNEIKNSAWSEMTGL